MDSVNTALRSIIISFHIGPRMCAQPWKYHRLKQMNLKRERAYWWQYGCLHTIYTLQIEMEWNTTQFSPHKDTKLIEIQWNCCFFLFIYSSCFCCCCRCRMLYVPKILFAYKFVYKFSMLLKDQSKTREFLYIHLFSMLMMSFSFDIDVDIGIESLSLATTTSTTYGTQHIKQSDRKRQSKSFPQLHVL